MTDRSEAVAALREAIMDGAVLAEPGPLNYGEAVFGWFDRHPAEAAAVSAALRPESEKAEPVGDLPDQMTIAGHLFVHVAACPCPRIQAEVARLEAGRAEWKAEDDND